MMMREFLSAHGTSMFLFGLFLAVVVGVAEGFRNARNESGVFSYRKVLIQATCIVVFYLIFCGGSLFMATKF